MAGEQLVYRARNRSVPKSDVFYIQSDVERLFCTACSDKCRFFTRKITEKAGEKQHELEILNPNPVKFPVGFN
jgi:hypothetical protein